MQERFSPVAYANQLILKQAVSREEGGSNEGSGVPSGREEAWFYELVEALRLELASARGRNEEERQRYTDTLNRAVLGYEFDRRRLLAVVQDELAKRRVDRSPPIAYRKQTLAEAVFAEIIGWSSIEAVLKDRDGLEEIQVVGERIYEVRRGQPQLSIHRLGGIRELERLQQNLVLFNGDTLNVRKKWAEVRLLDGSRVTMTGFGFTSLPTLTIRFFSTVTYELDELTKPEFSTLNERMTAILRSVIRSEFNMVLIGATNSGKTSMIKAMIREMPDQERLITLESRSELMIKRDFPEKNVVEYEIDEEDPRHNGYQAFKLALRQSPKRICHAEIRDHDAVIYVRACTRGHAGSITTVHASELEDVPAAITDMCMMDERGMDAERLTRRITEYVTQIGIQMVNDHGFRRIVRIGELVYEAGNVRVRDWVRYDLSAKVWEFPLEISVRSMKRLDAFDRGWDMQWGRGAAKQPIPAQSRLSPEGGSSSC